MVSVPNDGIIRRRLGIPGDFYFCGGKINVENSPSTRFAMTGYVTVMAFDYAEDHRQPQTRACSSVLSGENGSKTRSRISFSIPWPVSDTVSSTYSPSLVSRCVLQNSSSSLTFFVSKANLPPSGMACAALTAKLRRICYLGFRQRHIVQAGFCE